MSRRFAMFLMVSVLLVGVAPVSGQEAAAPQGSLAMTYAVDVLPGHQAAFEEGYAAHMKLHAEAGDPWQRETWMVVAGEHVGRYYMRSFGHSWASLDDEAEVPNDVEHLESAVMPHVHHLSSMVVEWMPQMSRWPEGPEPPKMVDVTMFTLDYGGVEDFFLVAKKMHSMIGDKALPLQYAWGEVVVGGSGVQLILAMPRSGWSDFEPPKPGIWQVAEEVYGATEGRMMRAMIGEAIKDEQNYVVQYRPDLSYVPGQ